jgi:hypothetical protein
MLSDYFNVDGVGCRVLGAVFKSPTHFVSVVQGRIVDDMKHGQARSESVPNAPTVRDTVIHAIRRLAPDGFRLCTVVCVCGITDEETEDDKRSQANVTCRQPASISRFYDLYERHIANMKKRLPIPVPIPDDGEEEISAFAQPFQQASTSSEFLQGDLAVGVEHQLIRRKFGQLDYLSDTSKDTDDSLFGTSHRSQSARPVTSRGDCETSPLGQVQDFDRKRQTDKDEARSSQGEFAAGRRKKARHNLAVLQGMFRVGDPIFCKNRKPGSKLRKSRTMPCVIVGTKPSAVDLFLQVVTKEGQLLDRMVTASECQPMSQIDEDYGVMKNIYVRVQGRIDVLAKIAMDTAFENSRSEVDIPRPLTGCTRCRTSKCGNMYCPCKRAGMRCDSNCGCQGQCLNH